MKVDMRVQVTPSELGQALGGLLVDRRVSRTEMRS